MPTPDNYISWEEYLSWMTHPVTRIILQARESDIAKIQSFIGDGGTLNGESVEATALSTAANVGYIKGLREALSPPDYLSPQGE